MIWGRACLYKAKEIIWLGYAFGLNILRSEILGYCFKSSIYMKVKWKENLWRVISRALQLRKCGGATGDTTEAPQKAQCGGATEGAVRRRHRRCSAETPQRRHRRRSAKAPQKAQCGGATGDATEAPLKAQCGGATEGTAAEVRGATEGEVRSDAGQRKGNCVSVLRSFVDWFFFVDKVFWV